jgi:hypothetical protein
MSKAYILAKGDSNFYAVDTGTGYPYVTNRIKQAVIFNNENDAIECLLDNENLKDYSVFKIVLQPIDNHKKIEEVKIVKAQIDTLNNKLKDLLND